MHDSHELGVGSFPMEGIQYCGIFEQFPSIFVLSSLALFSFIAMCQPNPTVRECVCARVSVCVCACVCVCVYACV